MKKFDALDMLLGRPAKFCAEFEPGKGMLLKCSGADEVDVVLTACFGLVHFMMQNGKKGCTADEAKAALVQAIEMAFEIYSEADAITVVDMNEVRRQAQDADQ